VAEAFLIIRNAFSLSQRQPQRLIKYLFYIFNFGWRWGGARRRRRSYNYNTFHSCVPFAYKRSPCSFFAALRARL